MMIEIGITVALIILLITILIVLRKRKKCTSCAPKERLVSESKAPEQVKPQQETKTAAKPVVNSELVAASARITAAQIVQPAVVQADENSSPLPQDSILRRHYFTHLCSMIEALAPPRPTESVLRRHYDMMIVSKIVQCLNDKKATEQLICDYEKLSV